MLVIGALARRRGVATAGAGGRPLPWFVVGFFTLTLLRSVGASPDGPAGVLREASRLLTILAMAALGLGVELAAGRLLLLIALGLLIVRGLPASAV